MRSSPMIRGALVCVAASAVLATAGCGEDTSEPGDATASVNSATTSSPTTPSNSQPVDKAAIPVPPGAAGWPTKDVASCQELASIQDAKVFARVPVLSPDCVTFPLSNDFLVIGSTRIDDLKTGNENGVAIPGFDGTVDSLMPQLNRGVVRLVQPQNSDAKYLVLWDGDTDTTVDELIADLFEEG